MPIGRLTSWATMETNIDLAVSSFFISVTSRSTTTAPAGPACTSWTGLTLARKTWGPIAISRETITGPPDSTVSASSAASSSGQPASASDAGSAAAAQAGMIRPSAWLTRTICRSRLTTRTPSVMHWRIVALFDFSNATSSRRLSRSSRNRLASRVSARFSSPRRSGRRSSSGVNGLGT